MANDKRPNNGKVRGSGWGIFLFILFLLAFLALTWCLTWYDVQPIGVGGTTVGFATINGLFNSLFPGDAASFRISEVIGNFCLLLAACNAILALGDLIHNRGFRRMHKRYLVTMFYYTVIVGLYIAFSLIPINSRPNNFEQSYPSSHTLLALNVLYSEIVLLGYGARRHRDWIEILDVFLVIAMIAMVVFRLLSGVHWLTDIAGGLLLSFSLMSLYRVIVRKVDRRPLS